MILTHNLVGWQVEHPVSEMISHVNIPSCQVLVGCGVPLHAIPDIRRMFGLDPASDTTIDFEQDTQVPPQGAFKLRTFPFTPVTIASAALTCFCSSCRLLFGMQQDIWACCTRSDEC